MAASNCGTQTKHQNPKWAKLGQIKTDCIQVNLKKKIIILINLKKVVVNKLLLYYIRSRIASTIQSASLHDSNLTKDEQQALKQLKNDKDIVILPADKGRVTVVMNKTNYHDKMDALVNDKQTYEELKRDPTPTLQRKLNSKIRSRRLTLLTLNATTD